MLSLFPSLQASFVSNTAKMDIDVDDPEFWSKWAQKAAIDVTDIEVFIDNFWPALQASCHIATQMLKISLLVVQRMVFVMQAVL